MADDDETDNVLNVTSTASQLNAQKHDKTNWKLTHDNNENVDMMIS